MDNGTFYALGVGPGDPELLTRKACRIDLGPEGGDGGGTLVAAGTPEEVAAVQESYTGQYLKKYLK